MILPPFHSYLFPDSDVHFFDCSRRKLEDAFVLRIPEKEAERRDGGKLHHTVMVIQNHYVNRSHHADGMDAPARRKKDGIQGIRAQEADRFFAEAP